MKAVIMAGGRGNRLRPFTDTVPKPLLPIGGVPILDKIINQLQDIEVMDITVVTNYRAQQIEDAVGHRARCVVEPFPMGTAGALSLLDIHEQILVMNADLVTDINFIGLRRHHQIRKFDVTIATRNVKSVIPYGVLTVNRKGEVTAIVEKPTVYRAVSAGIYFLNPSVVRLVPPDKFYDMPDLLNAALDECMKLGAYELCGEWRDIGTPEEYRKALDTFTE